MTTLRQTIPTGTPLRKAKPERPPIIPGHHRWTDFRTEAAMLLTLAPAKCQEILEVYNTRNRTMSPSNVNYLTRQLAEGHWKVNGETIKFSREGVLLDGQKRLQAAVNAGRPLVTWVISGVDAEAYDSIDRGQRRTPADDLGIRGEAHSKRLAAALAVLVRERMTGGLSKMTIGQHGVPTGEIQAMLDAHPGIRQAVEDVHDYVRAKQLLTPRVAAYCMYRFGLLDAPATGRFFTDLDGGEDLKKGDPVLALRDLLAGKHGRTRPIAGIILALTIKAWNARREGKMGVPIHWRGTGPSREPFPTIR